MKGKKLKEVYTIERIFYSKTLKERTLPRFDIVETIVRDENGGIIYAEKSDIERHRKSKMYEVITYLLFGEDQSKAGGNVCCNRCKSGSFLRIASAELINFKRKFFK